MVQERWRRDRPDWLQTALVSCALSGCYQGVGENGSAGGEGSADAGETAGTAGEEGGTVGEGEELPAPTTRVYRLTHTQWENTVQDLFFLPQQTGLAAEFRQDPLSGGFMFDNNATSLEVDQSLWTSYQQAASLVAEQVTTDAALMNGILPPDGGDDAARAQQFIVDFGKRAFRRPLTDAEVSAYLGSYDAAAALYAEIDPFTAGIRHVIQTFLQSPHFLYRLETSSEADGDMIPLTSWEVASRLSYFVWNSMPDEELFAAAEANALLDDAGLEAQALRMVEDPRAGDVFTHFNNQLMHVEKFGGIAPSPTFFPGISDQLSEFAIEENDRFVRDVVFGGNGGLGELLTSTETFVNADLAAIYGIEGSYDASFVQAQLDPAQRKGILTQVGFLASNSTSVNPDPIHRGVFLAKRMACMVIAAPPDGVPPLPPPDGRTNRQTVEEHTEQPGSNCVACHGTIINPFGFPFENYDAVGAWRTEDLGMPVDASSTVMLDGSIDVQNALELIDALAASATVHDCYARHLLEFSEGRQFVPEDEPLVERLGTTSLEGDASMKELLVTLVTSRGFRNRSTEELP